MSQTATTSASRCGREGSRTWSPGCARAMNPRRMRLWEPRTRPAASAVPTPARAACLVKSRRVSFFMLLSFLLSSSPGTASCSLHEFHHCPVLRPGQVVQGVLDVLQFAELAGPAAAGQLPGRVGWKTVGVGEQGDFFEARFRRVVGTGHVTEGGERRFNGGKGLGARQGGGPELRAAGGGPPPVRRVTRRPRDAIVSVVFGAGDLIAGAHQAREEVLDPLYHR